LLTSKAFIMSWLLSGMQLQIKRKKNRGRQMIRIWLPIATFFFFLVDGTVMQVLPIDHLIGQEQAVPRFSMVVILLIVAFMNRSTALLYGMIFGLFEDVVYTDFLGVYMFSMAFTAYVVASIAKVIPKNIAIVLILGWFGLTLLEFQAFGLYHIVGIARST